MLVFTTLRRYAPVAPRTASSKPRTSSVPASARSRARIDRNRKQEELVARRGRQQSRGIASHQLEQRSQRPQPETRAAGDVQDARSGVVAQQGKPAPHEHRRLPAENVPVNLAVGNVNEENRTLEKPGVETGNHGRESALKVVWRADRGRQFGWE